MDTSFLMEKLESLSKERQTTRQCFLDKSNALTFNVSAQMYCMNFSSRLAFSVFTIFETLPPPQYSITIHRLLRVTSFHNAEHYMRPILCLREKREATQSTAQCWDVCTSVAFQFLFGFGRSFPLRTLKGV